MPETNEQFEMLVADTTEIVVSYVANNSLGAGEVSSLIQSVFETLSGLGQESAAPVARPDPAVSIRSSVKRDHVVCLEDGKKVKMLKRHLMTEHGLTPDDYRVRWGLASDYPMVAPDYADKRREIAKKIGLGQNPGQRRGRPKKVG